MANTLYANEVIENQVTDIMNTKLDAIGLMTVDTSLENVDGLKKTVNKYTYTGKVEKLAKGAKNSTKGSVGLVTTTYDIERYQQTFPYNEMEELQDSFAINNALNDMGVVMANEVKDEYFAELAKISKNVTFPKTGSFSYDTVVDALAEIGCEAEENTFIVMGTNMKKMIRKDSDFKAAQMGEILYSGQFGTIAGIPCVFSKLVPDDTAYITKKDAVNYIVKKSGIVKQSEDIESGDKLVVYERYGLVALVKDTESVKITRATA